MHFELKDIFTLCFAAVGAVLGVINTVHNLNQKRVRLKVIPKYAFPVSAQGELGQEMACIEVVNLSTFAVTITEVGFTIDGHPRKGKRAALPQPLLFDGKPWPRRLEPRQSVSTYFELHKLPRKIGKAYAFTDCLETELGDSPALAQLRDKLCLG